MSNFLDRQTVLFKQIESAVAELKTLEQKDVDDIVDLKMRFADLEKRRLTDLAMNERLEIENQSLRSFKKMVELHWIHYGYEKQSYLLDYYQICFKVRPKHMDDPRDECCANGDFGVDHNCQKQPGETPPGVASQINAMKEFSHQIEKDHADAQKINGFFWLIEHKSKESGAIFIGKNRCVTMSAWEALHFRSKDEAQNAISTLNVPAVWEAMEHGFDSPSDPHKYCKCGHKETDHDRRDHSCFECKCGGLYAF